MEFKQYLKELAKHEKEKCGKYLEDPRKAILVHAGIALNWLGDFFANENIKWEKQIVDVNDIIFTGTNPKTNEILLQKCARKPSRLVPYLKEHPEDKEYLLSEASYSDKPILLRISEGKYKVVDGMHRFVGSVLQEKDEIEAYVAINESEILPVCEPHVVYDLIRGFIRNAKDDEGKEDLFHSLKLLSRTYSNVDKLLKERFNSKYESDEDVQEVISKVINKKGDRIE
jgi:hypothetical protein